MTDVLAESLNTGTVYVQQLVGKESFRNYVEAFGFGKKTGIELAPESKGNIQSLQNKGKVASATASFGQGITVTPIQLLAAYGAIANGGKLMRPYLVDEILKPDGSQTRTKPIVVSQSISARTARLITGMLVSVVEVGHGKRAGVPGYWVAGKTGTAQVPRTDGLGYQKDVSIGSFAGYAPANDPKFVMLVVIDHPRDVQWAESSAAPLFGEMADFLLTYMQVPPERPVGKSPPAPTPTAPPSATSTRL
jgi:cell division protein FtsI (penicillin-binding protein 3)/stage V sporulation protein D (sporulation-specific penicillin-binding protein)